MMRSRCSKSSVGSPGGGVVGRRGDDPVKIAVLSDVHANRAALVASLAAIDAEGVDRLVCLGDQVGYYAEPDACVEMLRARGTAAVAGNHDRVAAGIAEPVDFGQAARSAILWTRAHQRGETAR